MSKSPHRGHGSRGTPDTRDRIADTALKLFLTQGYSDTTIDQIAATASVSRRTVFHHFPTKDAILFDHLTPSRDALLRRLDERPSSEPLLVSLLLVLRDLCSEGHDRRLLAQIRSVITQESQAAGQRLWGGVQAFQREVTETLIGRLGDRYPPMEISAVTRMVFGWYVTASHFYLMEGRTSLLECFDEVVAACARSIGQHL